jgi:phenylacetate-CoA ligase
LRSISAGVLPDLLAELPACTFDVEEYVLSTRHASALAAVWPEGAATEASIAAAIREHFSACVPGYAAHRYLARFADLPVIDKAEVVAHRYRYVNRDFALTELWCASTFGTSGVPATFFYSPAYYFAQLLLTLPKIARRAGLPAVNGHRTMSVNITDVRSSGDRIVLDPTGLRRPIVQLCLAEASAEPLDRCCDTIARLRPAIVSSRPELFEEMLTLGTLSHRLGGHRPAVLVSSGSELQTTLRSRVEAAFGAPMLNVYALAEFGFVASQCVHRGAMHLDPGFIAEVIDDFGSALPSGVAGDLLLSSVRNEAMPLVRYRPGDRAVLSDAPCACGYSGVSIERITGRKVPLFKTPTRAAMSPSHLNTLLSRFPIRQFQITQHAVDAFEIGIEPLEPGTEDVAILAGVEAYVEEALGGGVTVTAALQSFRYDRRKFVRYRSLIGHAQPA